MLTAKKDGANIVFEIDGRKCTYNLSTHETIGFSGRKVKSLDTQLCGYHLDDVINAFDNDNYANFLKFVSKNAAYMSNRPLRSMTTIMKYIPKYSRFEQYFAAGIQNVDAYVQEQITEIPKPVVKFGRDGGRIDTKLLQIYKRLPDACQVVFRYNGEMTAADKDTLLKTGGYRSDGSSYFVEMVELRGYNPVHLVRYAEQICMYEALSVHDCMMHLRDYANMMHRISPKFDRYPKNLLTVHAIASRNYNRLKEVYDAEAFERRRKPELECIIGDYAFIYPKNIDAIKDEAVQQNNCVASYIKKVIDGHCDIMFMRKKDTPDKSLVTLEVRDGCKIVQARQRYNHVCSDKQNEVINKWEAKHKKESVTV